MRVCRNRPRGDFFRHFYLSSRLLYFAGNQKALFPVGVCHHGQHLCTKRMGCAHFLDIFVCGNLTTGRAAESGTVAGDFIAFLIFWAFSLMNLEIQLAVLHHRLRPILSRFGFTEDIRASQRDVTATRGIGTFDRPHPNPCKGYLATFRLRISIRQQLQRLILQPFAVELHILRKSLCAGISSAF